MQILGNTFCESVIVEILGKEPFRIKLFRKHVNLEIIFNFSMLDLFDCLAANQLPGNTGTPAPFAEGPTGVPWVKRAGGTGRQGGRAGRVGGMVVSLDTVMLHCDTVWWLYDWENAVAIFLQ